MHLRRVQQWDLYDFAQVLAEAMRNDEVMLYLAPYKDQYPDSWRHHVLYRAKLRYYRGEELYLAVTDDSDPDWTGKEQIMGYCSYSHNIPNLEKPAPGGWLGNFFERKALDLKGTYTKWFRLDQSADLVAAQHSREAFVNFSWDIYYDTLPKEVKQRVNGKHFELELLGTHPDFRRRGVGKMMLEEGFRKARQHHVPLVLFSSHSGERLYQSQGFKEVTRTELVKADTVNKGQAGHDSMLGLSWASMVWEPEDFRE